MMKIEGASTHSSNPAQPSRDELRLKKACKDLESIFLSYTLKSMRKTVSKSGLMDSGIQGNIFQEMLDDEFCKAAAQTGATGIAQTVYRQLNKSAAEQGQVISEDAER